MEMGNYLPQLPYWPQLTQKQKDYIAGNAGIRHYRYSALPKGDDHPWQRQYLPGDAFDFKGRHPRVSFIGRGAGGHAVPFGAGRMLRAFRFLRNYADYV